MISIVEHTDKESPDPGGYNDEPEGMTEISEEEFAQSAFFSYTPKALEFRQVRTKDGKYCDLHIFWMDTEKGQSEGFAFSNDYWGGKVKYYRVGCDHKYSEMSQQEAERRGYRHYGMCWHVAECTKCKKVISYDSSG